MSIETGCSDSSSENKETLGLMLTKKEAVTSGASATIKLTPTGAKFI